MSLNNDYFLLYHGIQVPHDKAYTFNTSLSDLDFFELSALIISITRHNLDAFTSLEYFKEITLHFTPTEILSPNDLYQLQNAIITHLLAHNLYENVHLLDEPLEYLVKEKILCVEAYKKLCSLFEHEEVQEVSLPKSHPQSRDFLHNKHALILAINELKALFVNNLGLVELLGYLEQQRFSIGITGVMNSGKSSMINALMGEEILGTNVIPETANLSLIKHATKPYAKVIYWNQTQWKQMERSALELESMKKFMQETKEDFKDTLPKYILEKAREEVIEVSALHEYTSAKGKHSNLVKMIELGYNLHFLKENIELVDTPGLDDVVIQREEITKEYIAQCDLLIHLMNVSQSATQKDVEFIIDAVRFQNITQILIVITRVDMVSAKEIKEVIAYTKSAIERKLQALNVDASLDFILKNIRFIALSSKMALHHKLGASQRALDAGYTLEQSGLPEIERYLHETLYGVNSARSNLILRAAKQRLFKTTAQNIELLKYELTLLSKSKDELQEEMKSLLKRQETSQTKLSTLTQEINSFKPLLENYGGSLRYILEEESKKLQTLLKQRLLDETSYALKKEKTKPTLSRVTILIENSMRHGLVDILRDHRYALIKKMGQLKASIVNYYPESEIDALSLDLEKQFNTSQAQITIQSSLEVFVKKAFKLCTSSKLKHLDEALTVLIREEFIYFDEQLQEKSQRITLQTEEAFFEQLNDPIKAIKVGISEQQILLEKHTKTLQSNEDNSVNNKAVEIHNNIKNIELIISRFSL